jgi:hypothetical protein
MPSDPLIIGPDDPWPAPPSVYVRGTASEFLANRLTDPDYRRAYPKLLEWGNSTWEFGNPPPMHDVERDSIWGLHVPVEVWQFQSDWDVTAGLPDGRLVILKETQVEWDTPRLTVMVSSDHYSTEVDIVDGGPVDSSEVLPVRFRIPDGGGWIVADKGKALSYRTAPDGEWQDAGRDAALLPDNTTEVTVDGETVALN